MQICQRRKRKLLALQFRTTLLLEGHDERVGIFLLIMMKIVTVENDGRVLRNVHSLVHKVLGGVVWRRHPERRVRALYLE
jgi:hypothetical protein